MRPLIQYLSEYRHISIAMALNLLSDIKADGEQVLVWDYGENGVKATTPRQLCSGFPAHRKASTIGPFQFLGGPPDRINWLDGSLLTFVVDKIMYKDAIEEDGTHVPA
jgi:hypothetical protein